MSAQSAGLVEPFMPHGVCYAWQPDVLWLNVGSDVLIAAAYYSIPLALLLFVRKRPDVSFRWMIWLFAAFILLCGTTHILGAVTVWEPIYVTQGWLKLLTAMVSVATAVLLWPLLPKAIALPSPAQMARKNASLRAEMQRREQRERQLEQLQQSLERRIAERTAELERSNALLASHARRMSQAETRKDRFLGVLAHELRSPLTPIRNAAFLLRDTSDPKQIQRAAAMIDDQVTHMARLIEDLSDTQRIVSGQIELRKQLAVAQDVVRAALDTVQPLLDENRHRLAVTMPPAPLTIEVDPARLRQILTNLLNNAALYTDAHGEIGLELRQDGQDAVFRIRDNGMGMEPQQCEALFDMFARSEQAVSKVKTGLGLGLAVVRRLVELHGGSVSVHSDGPGAGSEFIVRLPDVVRDAQSPAAVRAPASLQGLKILVVDDHRLSADSLREALAVEGADVQAVYTGADAVQCADHWRPAVVLLDIELPDASGYDVAQRLRSLAGLEHLQLVALTGHHALSRPEMFACSLLKPVELDQLLHLLETLRS